MNFQGKTRLFASILALSAGCAGSALEARADTKILTSVSATTVNSTMPDQNNYWMGAFSVDTTRSAYLRFMDYTLCNATITHAQLQMYPINDSNQTQSVTQMVPVPWDPLTLTWANRPTAEVAVLGTFGPVQTHQNLNAIPVIVDVTAALNANKCNVLTLLVKGKNDPSQTLWVDNERARHPAMLLVDFIPGPPEQVKDNTFKLGVNIGPPVYYGTDLPFINLMKMASTWYTQCNPYTQPVNTMCAASKYPRPGAGSWDTLEQDKISLDADGWPTSLPDPANSVRDNLSFTEVDSLMPAGLSPTRPSGRVIVRYDGEGTVGYSLDGKRNAALSTPGRDVLDFAPRAGSELASNLQLHITKTDPNKTGNYIRNIRVVPDSGVCSNDAAQECNPHAANSCGAGQCQAFEDVVDSAIYHPQYLAKLKPYGVLRTMDFQNINNSTVVNWAGRKTLSSASWMARDGNAGAPVEAIAALGMKSGADIWINVPTRASDDYVRQMAATMRDGIGQQRVYVEYTNEIWNMAFSNGNWVEQQAVALWPQTTTSSYNRRLDWYGKRSVEICSLWKQVWADKAAQLFCVVNTQAVSPTSSARVLDCPLYTAMRTGRPCSADLDGLAIAPYFGYQMDGPGSLTQSTLEGWTKDADGGLTRLFHELNVGGDLPGGPVGGDIQAAIDATNAQYAVARVRNMGLVGYEGGQHLVGIGPLQSSAAITKLFIAANRDPRMGVAYTRYLNGWRDSAAGPMVLWGAIGPYSQWGSWGIYEYRDQPSSVKSDGIKEFLSPTR